MPTDEHGDWWPTDDEDYSSEASYMEDASLGSRPRRRRRRNRFHAADGESLPSLPSCYDSDSDCSSMNPNMICSKDHFKDVVEDLGRNWDCANPLEEYVLSSSQSDTVRFEIMVPSSEQEEFYDHFVELIETLCMIDDIWQVEVYMMYNTHRTTFSVNGQDPVRDSSEGDSDGAPHSAEEASNSSLGTSVTLNWRCHAPNCNLSLHRVLESMQSMTLLNIKTIPESYDMVLPDSFKAKTEVLQTPLMRLQQKNFPCLESLSVDSRTRNAEELESMVSDNLKDFTLLKSLSLDIRAEILAKSASTISTLSISNLTLNGRCERLLSSEALEKLLSGINHTKSLKHLELSSMTFDTESCEILSKSLTKLAGLQKIRMYEIFFPDSFTKEESRSFVDGIVNGIQKNPTLTEFACTATNSTKVRNFFFDKRAVIQHALRLNQAGRRVIEEMQSVPPNLVARILGKANTVYGSNGIYHLLRQHTDLRKVIAWYANITSIPSFVRLALESGIVSEEQAREMLELHKRRRLN